MEKANRKQIVEVRSAITDNVVVSFVHEVDSTTNIFTAGYNKICEIVGMNRVQAENRYYVTKG